MKKSIAPIIVTLVILAFLLFELFGVMMATTEAEGFLTNGFLILLIILLIIGMLTAIYVLFQRIKEIKEEDKDDLSQY